MARGSFGRYKEWIDLLSSSENLDELPVPTIEHRRTSFFSVLVKPDNLPFDDPVPGGQLKRVATGLLASEPLPSDDLPESRRGRSSFFTTLFAGEPLPEDCVPGPGPAGRGKGH